MKQLDRTRLVTLFLALAFVGLSLGFAWRHLAGLSDGVRLGPEEPFGESAWTADGVLVTPIEDTADGLHQNDLIVAIDGISIESWTQALTDISFPRPQWKLRQTVIYGVIRNGTRMEVPIHLQAYPAAAILAQTGTLPFVMAAFLISTTYIFARRPAEQAAVPLLVWSICMGSAALSILVGLQTTDIVDGVGFWLFKVATFGPATLGVVSVLNFALVFPQPHPLIIRFRYTAWMMRVVPITVYIGYLVVIRFQASSMLSWIVLLNATWPIIILVYLGLTVGTLLSGQFFARHNPVARRQGRLVVFSIALMGVLLTIFGLLPKIFWGHILLERNIMALAPLLVMAAIFTAIMRYRVFDIDIIINRTLVYGALTALVVALYSLVVGLLSEMLQSSGNFYISLIATGLIAILFQPLRHRLQRGVNRLMYGERDDPYAVLSHLGERLETTLAPRAILPVIVETISQTLKLPYTAIALKQGETFVVTAAYGHLRGEPLHLPLVYQGESVGELLLMARDQNAALDAADRRVLDGLTHQVAIAAHAVQLTLDLQRSREQLVTAREEERRRLRRDLHDGLGQALASLTLQLDALENLLDSDLVAAKGLLIDIRADTQGAISDIRRLVYDLRPPALDELGLLSALREQIAPYNHLNGLQVVFEAGEQLPPLPAAVEVAIYRITLEALTNVVRHAHAARCCISLRADAALHLEIADDGCGVPDEYRSGVGLAAMRERAAELGGTFKVESAGRGTRILVELPLNKE